MLKDCFDNNVRIRILIRRVDGGANTRGTLSGYCKAFDKHMNIVCGAVRGGHLQRLHMLGGAQALIDADERYLHRVVEYVDESRCRSASPRWHLRQSQLWSLTGVSCPRSGLSTRAMRELCSYIGGRVNGARRVRRCPRRGVL